MTSAAPRSARTTARPSSGRLASALRIAALVSLSTPAGCGNERYVGQATEVLVVVGSDLVPVDGAGRGELDAVRVTVAASCELLDRGGVARAFPVGETGEALPFSFGITPSRPEIGWCARVQARRSGHDVLEVVHSGEFLPEQTVVVGAFLSRECIDVSLGRPRACAETETCGAGGQCVPRGLAPEGALYDPTLCRAGDVVTCVTGSGALGRGRCGDDGSPPLGPRCVPIREVPGNSRDDDGRTDTPDDGGCSTDHPGGARRLREGSWTEGGCSTDDDAGPLGHLRWDEEVCLRGGAVRIGVAGATSPFADPESPALSNAEPSAVPDDETPSHHVVVPAIWADVFEVSFCRFLEFWSSAGATASATPRLEPGTSDRCAPGCPGDERCFVRSEREAFCVPEPVPYASPDNGCTWAPDDPRLIVGGPDEGSGPMNCVPWLTAEAFCEWDGGREGRVGRLPTEVEWERMARGLGDEERVFPWGNDAPDCTRSYSRVLSPEEVSASRCNPADGTYCGCTNLPDALASDAEGGANLGAIGPAPIEKLLLLGVAEVSPEGLYGLAGNVAEWTLDEYRQDAYAARCGADGRACEGDVLPVAPFVAPSSLRGGSRVVRGGSWSDPPGRQRVSARQAVRAQPVRDPDNPDRYDLARASATNGIGFRCVREP